MHRPIRERLEEFLTHDDNQALPMEFQAHLENCDECLETVQQMQQQARKLEILRAPASAQPDPGFYARVMERVEAQRPVSFWTAFLEPAFGKRLVYATLTLLVLLSTYLVSTEPGEPMQNLRGPEAILANQEKPRGFTADQQADRDVILVDLATYSSSSGE